MTSPSIHAHGISVTYPRPLLALNRSARLSHKALDTLSFEIEEGERVGLLGRNGSGKSTLLRTLAGVYPVSGGSLDVTGTTAAIFNATSGFVPHATGRENIMLRGVVLGLSREEIAELTPSILEFADLGEWIERPIMLYSSGMTLRLAFAITTSVRKDILLMDEWIGAGDAAFLQKAQARMAEMVEDSKIIVLATHNTPLMERVCDRAIVLRDAGIAYDGPVKGAIELYRTLRDGEAADADG